MSEKLLPCPFCGGEACMNEHVFTGYSSTFGVVCLDCCAETRQFYDIKEEAISAWNRRSKLENARAHARETGICPMCEDCPDGCPVETPKDSRNIITNADRIRGMSDEELAKHLFNFQVNAVCGWITAAGQGGKTVPEMLDWLRQPAKEKHRETD